MKYAIKSQTHWATPVVVVEPEDSTDINRKLAEIVLAKEQEIRNKAKPTQVAGVSDGMTAYWLTYNVLNWDYGECRLLQKLVLDGAREFIRLRGDPNSDEYRIAGISCWANVLRKGESLDIHHHDPAFVSAHYIVQSGHTDSSTENYRDSGHTVYYRPGFMDRSQSDSGFGGPWDSEWRISVPPKEGRLTFFPSYVRHEVKPHRGDIERISVAMDIYVKKQKNLPFYFGPPRWFVPE